MKTVYVDEMFVLNLIINYFILIATAKLCALPLTRLRFVAAAALGALYSVLLLLPELGFLATPITKICLGALMTLIAFGKVRRLFRVFAAFLAVSAAFGGTVFAATLLAGGYPDTGLYIDISMRVLVLSFAMCYFALTLVFRRLGRRRTRETAEVKIVQSGKEAIITALRDTGNELFDPVSGLPVMVADISAVLKLFPENSGDILKLGAPEFLELLGEYGLKFRLVPFRTVGTETALLPVFRPDAIFVNGRQKKDLLLGLTSRSLSSDGEYSAIL
jgi:stage II sporulation protein GA (sporulation sigma-E factor processing peptidase)